MLNNTLDINLAITKGVKYLHQHQFPNGEFCCFTSWGDDDSMQNAIFDSNVFPTSLICYSLLNLRHFPEVKEINERAAAFLQYQSMRGGIWNNYPSWAPFFKLCPPDVDNTSCASIVLRELKKDYPANQEMLLLNRTGSGLFYTWFTFRFKLIFHKNYFLICLRELKNPFASLLFWLNVEAKKYDVDAAVNANVLFYLGLNEETKAIIPYIIDIIKNNKESVCDHWYLDPFAIYYFFSRDYLIAPIELHEIKDPIISRILETASQDGMIGNSIFDTALGIVALINLGHDSDVIDNAANYLISTQNEFGEWPRWAVFYGGAKKARCYGSEETTIGFCLEALALYQILAKKRNESI